MNWLEGAVIIIFAFLILKEIDERHPTLLGKLKFWKKEDE